MSSIFSPKMPPLPPVQPLPEPPSAELSQEEKDRIASEQRAMERKRKNQGLMVDTITQEYLVILWLKKNYHNKMLYK